MALVRLNKRHVMLCYVIYARRYNYDSTSTELRFDWTAVRSFNVTA